MSQLEQCHPMYFTQITSSSQQLMRFKSSSKIDPTDQPSLVRVSVALRTFSNTQVKTKKTYLVLLVVPDPQSKSHLSFILKLLNIIGRTHDKTFNFCLHLHPQRLCHPSIQHNWSHFHKQAWIKSGLHNATAVLTLDSQRQFMALPLEHLVQSGGHLSLNSHVELTTSASLWVSHILIFKDEISFFMASKYCSANLILNLPFAAYTFGSKIYVARFYINVQLSMKCKPWLNWWD